MNKTFKIYGIVFLAAIGILTFLEFNKTEVIDWRKTFDTRHKSPFGLYIFNEEVGHLLHQKLQKTEQSPFDYYKEKSQKPHNILIINKEIHPSSWDKILDQVGKGSDALIFGEQIHDYLLDTLQIEHNKYRYGERFVLRLTDKKQTQDTLHIDKLPNGLTFNYLPEKHQILGYIEGDNTKLGIHFVSVPYGKGKFLLHLEPLVLTNYHLLKPNGGKHTQAIFSHLPDRETIWFTESHMETSSSIMRFILGNDGLKQAWWLLLAGLCLFTLFNIKRKQRVVPIIEPPRNKSLEFVQSIGNLYLQEGDMRDMMLKKSQYFLHYVRTEWFIDTHILDDVFIQKLHSKTGHSIEKITEAIALIQKAKDPAMGISNEDLLKLNEILDNIVK